MVLISGGAADTADAKLAIMEECGFTVTRNLSETAKPPLRCSARPAEQGAPEFWRLFYFSAAFGDERFHCALD